MSRKAISVVKPVFLNCTEGEVAEEDETCTSFISKCFTVWKLRKLTLTTYELISRKIFIQITAEIDGKPKKDATLMEGYLDVAFLFAYAFFMFIR